MDWQVWFSALLFLIVYAVIISEKIHRTVIALLGATLLVVLGILDFTEAIGKIDFETIGLLTGMMIIVGITKKSGVFEYMAIKAAHGSGGVKCDRSRSGSTRLHTLPMSGSSDRSQCTPHSS